MIWHSIALDAYPHPLYLMKYNVLDSENQKLITLLVAIIVLFFVRVVEWPRPSTDTLLRRAEGLSNLAVWRIMSFEASSHCSGLADA